MYKLPQMSGEEVTAVLMRHFGFVQVSQRGSHVKLRRMREGKIITTIAPLHKELALGTLRGILELAGIEPDEFIKFI